MVLPYALQATTLPSESMANAESPTGSGSKIGAERFMNSPVCESVPGPIVTRMVAEGARVMGASMVLMWG